eukprot:TRINITY_DN9771_c0_g2_i2.p1 TRINITY_DN9771_c0_g2~~TRINITY_DN9771_c0_g2_i2.p1  ORF type:complete len:267 (+),score=43.13 TRINITY_DN9771_c0_g2_i2:90-890(+)
MSKDFQFEGQAKIEEENYRPELTILLQKRDREGIKTRRMNKSSCFIHKLHRILKSGEAADILKWSEDGCSVVILDKRKLSQNVLPKFFKHGNYHSFVRQLNMYGFQKIRKTQGQDTFTHHLFRQGYDEIVRFIKRPPETEKPEVKEMMSLCKELIILKESNTVLIEKEKELEILALEQNKALASMINLICFYRNQNAVTKTPQKPLESTNMVDIASLLRSTMSKQIPFFQFKEEGGSPISNKGGPSKTNSEMLDDDTIVPDLKVEN